MGKSGETSANQPKNSTESSEGPSQEIDFEPVPLRIGSFDIDDVIRKHIIDCDQCREGIARSRPVRLGEKSKHCDTYWDLQLRRAEYEGAVNNIVGHTEFGDEAPRRGQLQ